MERIVERYLIRCEAMRPFQPIHDKLHIPILLLSPTEQTDKVTYNAPSHDGVNTEVND